MTPATHPDLRLPKFWRPKLKPAVQTTAQIAHWDLVHDFTHGRATRTTLLEWIATGFTYSQMMRLLADEGEQFTPEAVRAITDQLESYAGVKARYEATGRAGFNATELNTARAAAHVMDQLITMDKHGIALRAVVWSNAQMAQISISSKATAA